MTLNEDPIKIAIKLEIQRKRNVKIKLVNQERCPYIPMIPQLGRLRDVRFKLGRIGTTN